MTNRDTLRAMVVVNPASAAGATGRRWDRTARHLSAALGPFELAFSQEPGHATRLTRLALRDGFEMVVAVGGDGTLNEVVNGFFEAKVAVAPEALLGFVALGTGSDYALVRFRAYRFRAPASLAIQRRAYPRTRRTVGADHSRGGDESGGSAIGTRR